MAKGMGQPSLTPSRMASTCSSGHELVARPAHTEMQLSRDSLSAIIGRVFRVYLGETMGMVNIIVMGLETIIIKTMRLVALGVGVVGDVTGNSPI